MEEIYHLVSSLHHVADIIETGNSGFIHASYYESVMKAAEILLSMANNGEDGIEVLELQNQIYILQETIATLARENDNFRNRTVEGEILVLRQRITDLNQTIDTLIADNKRNVESGRYYRMIQDAIKDDETLQDAWAQFIVLLKLRMVESVPGLTKMEMMMVQNDL